VALSSDVKKGMKPEELDELLNGLEKLLERTKVLYEQYFMGIQKMAPLQLHRDVERKVRELMQQQIRNTALRFRFTTLSQKFGSYSTYWKRTLREIEQGKYVRDLARVKRKADQMGEELPEELLVKLPKLVQDRIRRDRERMAERAMRDAEHDIGAHGTSAGESGTDDSLALHEISEVEAQSLFNEDDLDLDSVFQALTEARVPEGTPLPGWTRAVPAADQADAHVSAHLPDRDTAGPEAGEAPDSWAESPEPAVEPPAVEPPTPAESMVAQGKGRAARARAKTVTSPMGKAIAASRPSTPDASDASDAPPVAARPALPDAPVAAPSAAAPSAPPVFRVPLPPGASPRPSAIPPEPPAAVPLPPVLPRSATGPQPAPAPPVPRTMTGQTPPVPPGPAPPMPPRTMTGQTPPVPPGPAPPMPPRNVTGQPAVRPGPAPPVPPRNITGQAPPASPRAATGQPTPARAATAQPVSPGSVDGQQTAPPRAATPPPLPRAATPPPPPRAAAGRRAEPPPHPAPDLPPGMDDRECRELYARYLKARQLVGESNDEVTYERLVSSLSKQASAIMNQHSARGVQFHVVVRGDKVVLKAKPLKPGKDE
jgi:hypothetical protein